VSTSYLQLAIVATGVLQPGFDAPYRSVCDNRFVDVFKRGRNLAFSSTVGFGSNVEDTGH
jgi:hypothetical protein